MKISKKLFYLKIIAILSIILVFALCILIINTINKDIKKNDYTIDMPKIAKTEVEFDMTLPPNQQKHLKGHVREYMSQVYDYLFEDIKWKNIQDPFPYDYSALKQKGNTDNFYNLLKSYRYSPLFYLLFNFEENVKIFDEMYINYPLNFDDIPVTENYKQKHPDPLFIEFNFIKKEDYKYPKIFYNEYMDFDYWYEFNYDYRVGVDEKNRTVIVTEEKHVNLLYKDRDTNEEGSGIVRDKEGNEVTTQIETRRFYFIYTVDDNGYVDDIVYNSVEILADDKYLDNLIKYE